METLEFLGETFDKARLGPGWVVLASSYYFKSLCTFLSVFYDGALNDSVERSWSLTLLSILSVFYDGSLQDSAERSSSITMFSIGRHRGLLRSSCQATGLNFQRFLKTWKFHTSAYYMIWSNSKEAWVHVPCLHLLLGKTGTPWACIFLRLMALDW